MSSFQHLGLSQALVSTVEKLGFDTPTPIQEQAIPHVLEGKDVLAGAQTGTGKTAAFGDHDAGVIPPCRGHNIGLHFLFTGCEQACIDCGLYPDTHNMSWGTNRTYLHNSSI